MYRWILAILLAFALTLPIQSGPGRAQEHDGHHGQPDQVGKVHFPVSCSLAAQERFDRGVALLHSFWFAPSRQAFTAATEADPSCGMGHWGIAMTWLDNPLGGSAPPASVQAGQAAVVQARAVGAPTQREQEYIAAIAAF